MFFSNTAYNYNYYYYYYLLMIDNKVSLIDYSTHEHIEKQFINKQKILFDILKKIYSDQRQITAIIANPFSISI